MRNEVIPVYSLARKFGKEQEATAESTIIISSGGLKLALEVDEVLEINDIDESHILPMPSMLVKADTQYLDRVANVDGKLILLLDVEKLLSDDEAEDVEKNYRRTAERVKLKLLQGDMEVAMMKNETKKQTFDRSAGVLMSISSLPSDYGIGTMGKRHMNLRTLSEHVTISTGRYFQSDQPRMATARISPIRHSRVIRIL